MSQVQYTRFILREVNIQSNKSEQMKLAMKTFIVETIVKDEPKSAPRTGDIRSILIGFRSFSQQPR